VSATHVVDRQSSLVLGYSTHTVQNSCTFLSEGHLRQWGTQAVRHRHSSDYTLL